MQNRSTVWLQPAVLLLTMGIGTAPAAVEYTITGLGAYGSGEPTGINSTGQVSGEYQGTEQSAGYLYSDGTITGIGTLPPPFSGDVYTGGINSSGQIVGAEFDSDVGTPISRAFVFSNGVTTGLGTLSAPYDYSSGANAINDAGQIVGYSDGVNAGSHAFLYTDGNMVDLGTLGGSYSIPFAINNGGEVVGQSYTSGNEPHAFLYADTSMADLGTLGGSESCASAINNAGQIVGYSEVSGNSAVHAFVYGDGTMTDLGTMGYQQSYAEDINDVGEVVGLCENPDTGGTAAFLYCDGTMTDLESLLPPDSGWNLFQATAINDEGQVVGWGIGPNGQEAFLATPTSEVPEPMGAAIMALGVGIILASRQRQLSAVESAT
jgi:probable HAF family extracellular repeat protein